MTELEKDLGTRGFAGKLVRADDPGADMAVLSIASGLTVWCRSGAAWLRAPGTSVQQWGYCDLVEVAEQTVQAYETTIAMAEPGALAAASRTGALVPWIPAIPLPPRRLASEDDRGNRRQAGEPAPVRPARRRTPSRVPSSERIRGTCEARA